MSILFKMSKSMDIDIICYLQYAIHNVNIFATNTSRSGLPHDALALVVHYYLRSQKLELKRYVNLLLTFVFASNTLNAR